MHRHARRSTPLLLVAGVRWQLVQQVVVVLSRVLHRGWRAGQITSLGKMRPWRQGLRGGQRKQRSRLKGCV